MYLLFFHHIVQLQPHYVRMRHLKLSFNELWCEKVVFVFSSDSFVFLFPGTHNAVFGYFTDDETDSEEPEVKNERDYDVPRKTRKRKANTTGAGPAKRPKPKVAMKRKSKIPKKQPPRPQLDIDKAPTAPVKRSRPEGPPGPRPNG